MRQIRPFRWARAKRSSHQRRGPHVEGGWRRRATGRRQARVERGRRAWEANAALGETGRERARGEGGVVLPGTTATGVGDLARGLAGVPCRAARSSIQPTSRKVNYARCVNCQTSRLPLLLPLVFSLPLRSAGWRAAASAERRGETRSPVTLS